MSDTNVYDPYEKTYSLDNAEPFEPDYAGFLVRFVAYFIDGLILSVLMFAIMIVVIFAMALLVGVTGVISDSENGLSAVFGCMYCLSAILMIAMYWLYFAFFESSRYMGTPGKILLGIKVTDESGDRISFVKASFRFFAKVLTGSLFYLGFITILLSSKKQGLYDMVAGTIVVKKGE